MVEPIAGAITTATLANYTDGSTSLMLVQGMNPVKYMSFGTTLWRHRTVPSPETAKSNREMMDGLCVKTRVFQVNASVQVLDSNDLGCATNGTDSVPKKSGTSFPQLSHSCKL